MAFLGNATIDTNSDKANSLQWDCSISRAYFVLRETPAVPSCSQTVANPQGLYRFPDKPKMHMQPYHHRNRRRKYISKLSYDTESDHFSSSYIERMSQVWITTPSSILSIARNLP